MSVFPQRIVVAGDARVAGAPDVNRRDVERDVDRENVDRGKVDRGNVDLVVCDRILALFSALPPPRDPDQVATLYFAATATCTPDAGWLQAALQVLPADADVERRLLAGAVARAAEMSLAAVPAVTPRPARAFAGDLAPHARLDACFDVLAEQPGFEPRPGQRDMAHAVLDAFLARRPVIVEAGTGIGKTLAYALAAIVVAVDGERRVLLSTHTRNLQHQLCDRDLPALWERLGLAGLDLRFTKLLGRDNYVCDQALARWLARQRDQGGSIAAARLVLSRLRCPDGVVESDVPAEVLARRETCVGRACRACPVHRAREAARNAGLVVINHALLFADARTDSSVLGDWDALVLDEGHHVERVATQAFGMRFGRAQVEALGRPVQRLHAEIGVLHKVPELAAWSDRLDLWCDRQRDLQHRLSVWLQDLDAALPQRGRERPRQRYRDGDEAFGPVRAEAMHLVTHMQQITLESQAWLDDLHSEAAESPLLDDAVTLFELGLELHFETQTMLGFLVRGNTDGSNDDWAFYLDFGGAGRSLREIVALPLDVAPQVRELLYAAPRGIALTSATLYVDGDTAWFRSRIGLDPCPALRIESPFDYAAQCRALRTSGLGNASDPDFLPQVANLVALLSARTTRRTLVLLTSHRALGFLARELEERGIGVLAQGLHGTRIDLTRRFAGTPGAILLGVDSFWEGVDFPGDALELLVIVKLPFAVPDEPLVAARAERMRSAGEDPFAAFVLPEAVLRFRQGFGRLIRSAQDRGAVILLDPRLETREYGERFLEALPAHVEVFDAVPALVDAVADWFALVESAPRREAP